MEILKNSTLTTISPFLSNIIVLHYLYMLDKTNCYCSQLPIKKKIQIGFIILSIGSLLQIYFQYSHSLEILKIFSILYSILSIYIAFYVVRYVHNLQKKECKCSMNWKRSFMYFTSIFEIFIFLGSIFYAVYVSFMIQKK